MGQGYVFFEVLEPDEISYTYKLNPAAFSPPWNESFGEIKLVPGYPECGCSYLQNNDDIEGQIGNLTKFLIFFPGCSRRKKYLVKSTL